MPSAKGTVYISGIPKKAVTDPTNPGGYIPGASLTAPPSTGATNPSGYITPSSTTGTSNQIVKQAGTELPFGLPSLSSVGTTQSAQVNGANNYNEGNTDPITGLLAKLGYTPQGLSDLYGNPQPLAQDVLATLGIDNPGLAQSLSQNFNPALAANFILGQGLNSTSDADTLNFVANYLQQMVTPGGRTPEFDAMVNKILGAGSADSSPLGAFLNANQTPSQQISAGNSLIGQTLSGLNPYAQKAYSNYLDYAGNQYQGTTMKGNPANSSYVDYLNQSPFQHWVNGRS